jgi:hypothetical protein
MTVEAAGIYLDYSRNRIIPELLSKEEPTLSHGNSTITLIRRNRTLKEISG